MATTKSENQTEIRLAHSHPERLSASQKAAGVLRLLKGESASLLSEELGVSIRRLERWQSDFLAAGAVAMEKKKRPTLPAWYSKHSSSIVQWVGLLLALVATIAFLAYFLRFGSTE
jgi:Helix-turn-helix domain